MTSASSYTLRMTQGLANSMAQQPPDGYTISEAQLQQIREDAMMEGRRQAQKDFAKRSRKDVKAAAAEETAQVQDVDTLVAKLQEKEYRCNVAVCSALIALQGAHAAAAVRGGAGRLSALPPDIRRPPRLPPAG